MKCRKCGKDAWIGVETMLCDDCKNKPAKPDKPMTVSPPQDFAAFLESLKVKNEGPDEMHGWRFDWPLNDLMPPSYGQKDVSEFVQYLIERLRRAESNAKPDTLAEDVKAYMRAAMAISEKCADNSCPCPLDLDGTCYALEFRKLCEPGDK